jgi:hypothetical protein
MVLINGYDNFKHSHRECTGIYECHTVRYHMKRINRLLLRLRNFTGPITIFSNQNHNIERNRIYKDLLFFLLLLSFNIKP